MQYDNPIITYIKPAQDMSGANKTLSIIGPKGKRGLLIDYGFVDVTVAFAGATNPPEAEVGDGTTANKYGAAFNPGNLATASGGATVNSAFVAAPDNASWTALMVNRNLPADTPVVLTGIAAAGAGAAGTAALFLQVAWDK